MEYKYEKYVSRNSWYIRLFLYMWPVNPKDINFCMLFWGFIGAPFNLIGRFISWPFRKGIKKVIVWADSRPYIAPSVEEIRLKRERREVRQKKWSNRFSKFGAFIDRFIVAPIQKIPNLVWIIISAVLGLILLAGLIFYIVTFSTEVLSILLFLGLVIGGLGILLLVVICLAYFIDESDAGMSFRQAMKTGYYAVKTRTCPKIIIK